MPAGKMYKAQRRNPALKPTQKKQVKALVKSALNRNKETNSYSYSAAEEITSTIAVQDLSAYIVQGDGNDERVGDQLRMKSVRIRGRVIPKSTGVGDVVRILIIQWRPDTAVDTPTVAELFEDTATAGPTMSNYNMDIISRRKFKVLLDRTFLVPAYANANNRRDLFFDTVIKGSRISKVNYTPTATTGGNHLYLVRIGTQVSGTTASNFYHNTIQYWSE